MKNFLKIFVGDIPTKEEILYGLELFLVVLLSIVVVNVIEKL